MTAVVSGGTRGIGFAISQKLASQGYQVGILGRDLQTAKLAASRLPTTSTNHIAVECDVGKADQVERAMEEFREGAQGPVKVLINAAGINRDGLLVRSDPDDILATIETNLLGPIFLSRAVLKDMIKVKNGNIINIGSVIGIAGNPGQVVYSCSKAGLLGLTKSLAREVASRGIRVNLLDPGYVATDMLENLVVEDLRKRIPIGRIATPEEIADVAMFLLSPQASYITGQRIVADGGLS